MAQQQNSQEPCRRAWTKWDIARCFGVGVGTVNAWIKFEGLPCFRPVGKNGKRSRIVRFDEESVMAWFKEKQRSNHAKNSDGEQDQAE